MLTRVQKNSVSVVVATFLLSSLLLVPNVFANEAASETEVAVPEVSSVEASITFQQLVSGEKESDPSVSVDEDASVEEVAETPKEEVAVLSDATGEKEKVYIQTEEGKKVVEGTKYEQYLQIITGLSKAFAMSEEEFNQYMAMIEFKKKVREAIVAGDYDEYVAMTEGSVKQLSEAAFLKKSQVLTLKEAIREAKEQNDTTAVEARESELKALLGREYPMSWWGRNRQGFHIPQVDSVDSGASVERVPETVVSDVVQDNDATADDSEVNVEEENMEEVSEMPIVDMKDATFIKASEVISVESDSSEEAEEVSSVMEKPSCECGTTEYTCQYGATPSHSSGTGVSQACSDGQSGESRLHRWSCGGPVCSTVVCRKTVNTCTAAAEEEVEDEEA